MARNDRDATQPRLEGLLLFDGAEYYELPFAVIARYRVPEEHHGEVGAAPPNDADARFPWLVLGGIYAPKERQ